MTIEFNTPITLLGVTMPIVVAFIFIAFCSLPKEPARQKFSAVFVAGAGAAYFAGGFGLWEQVFCTVITVLAYHGLRSYRYVGIAWLLHSGWDFMHELYGNAIIPSLPSSSLGCMICDPVIALWYLWGAPSIWPEHRSPQLKNANR